MASMRKKGKGGHYYARFYDSSRSPKRKEVPLDTTRKKVARRLVELEEQFVTVRNRDDFTTKSGDERGIPLRSDALEVARRRDEEHDGDSDDPVFTDRSGRPIKADRITKRFKTFVRKAGLDEQENLHFHSFRHTCGAWLASSGVPLRVIQAILGHSSIDVTEIYSHLQPGVMGEAMEEAFG